jgi:hypothetical protein
MHLPTPEELTDSSTPALLLELRCNRCERTTGYETPYATIHPRPESLAEAWDGIVLGRVFECPACEQVDDYSVTARTRLELTARAIADAAGRGPGRVIVGECRLLDGTLVTRPSRALDHLRELAARHPEQAEGWRRLGNACERYGLFDRAEEAWRKAFDLDPDEFEAAFSLAERLFDDSPERAFPFLRRAVECLPKATGLSSEQRDGFGQALARLIARTLECTDDSLALRAMWQGPRVGNEVVAHVSSVDLSAVSDFGRLGSFMARSDVLGLALTSELPPDSPTQLECLLEGTDDTSRPILYRLPPQVRQEPRVGRNDPCPCKSGKKYKKCCLDAVELARTA